MFAFDCWLPYPANFLLIKGRLKEPAVLLKRDKISFFGDLGLPIRGSSSWLIAIGLNEDT